MELVIFLLLMFKIGGGALAGCLTLSPSCASSCKLRISGGVLKRLSEGVRGSPARSAQLIKVRKKLPKKSFAGAQLGFGAVSGSWRCKSSWRRWFKVIVTESILCQSHADMWPPCCRHPATFHHTRWVELPDKVKLICRLGMD